MPKLKHIQLDLHGNDHICFIFFKGINVSHKLHIVLYTVYSFWQAGLVCPPKVVKLTLASVERFSVRFTRLHQGKTSKGKLASRWLNEHTFIWILFLELLDCSEKLARQATVVLATVDLLWYLKVVLNWDLAFLPCVSHSSKMIVIPMFEK